VIDRSVGFSQSPPCCSYVLIFPFFVLWASFPSGTVTWFIKLDLDQACPCQSSSPAPPRLSFVFLPLPLSQTLIFPPSLLVCSVGCFQVLKRATIFSFPWHCEFARATPPAISAYGDLPESLYFSRGPVGRRILMSYAKRHRTLQSQSSPDPECRLAQKTPVYF